MINRPYLITSKFIIKNLLDSDAVNHENKSHDRQKNCFDNRLCPFVSIDEVSSQWAVFVIEGNKCPARNISFQVPTLEFLQDGNIWMVWIVIGRGGDKTTL